MTRTSLRYCLMVSCVCLSLGSRNASHPASVSLLQLAKASGGGPDGNPLSDLGDLVRDAVESGAISNAAKNAIRKVLDFGGSPDKKLAKLFQIELLVRAIDSAKYTKIKSALASGDITNDQITYILQTVRAAVRPRDLDPSTGEYSAVNAPGNTGNESLDPDLPEALINYSAVNAPGNTSNESLDPDLPEAQINYSAVNAPGNTSNESLDPDLPDAEINYGAVGAPGNTSNESLDHDPTERDDKDFFLSAVVQFVMFAIDRGTIDDATQKKIRSVLESGASSRAQIAELLQVAVLKIRSAMASGVITNEREANFLHDLRDAMAAHAGSG